MAWWVTRLGQRNGQELFAWEEERWCEEKWIEVALGWAQKNWEGGFVRVGTTNGQWGSALLGGKRNGCGSGVWEEMKWQGMVV